MINLEEILVCATTIFVGAAAMIWKSAINKDDKSKIYKELEDKVSKKEFNDFKSDMLKNQLSMNNYLGKIEDHLIMMDNNWRAELNKHFCDLKESLQMKN